MSVAARIAIIQSILLGWSSGIIVAPEPVYWLRGEVVLVSADYGIGYLVPKVYGFTQIVQGSENGL